MPPWLLPTEAAFLRWQSTGGAERRASWRVSTVIALWSEETTQICLLLGGQEQKVTERGILNSS